MAYYKTLTLLLWEDKGKSLSVNKIEYESIFMTFVDKFIVVRKKEFNANRSILLSEVSDIYPLDDVKSYKVTHCYNE